MNKLRERITRRAITLKESGCWIDKMALKQGFICPHTPSDPATACYKCFAQFGVLALIKEAGYLPVEPVQLEVLGAKEVHDILDYGEGKMV